MPGHTWAGSGFAYESEDSADQLNDRYVQLLQQVRDLEVHCGLSGAIYTQPYDVEMELNGLLTYDREVVKVDAKRVRDVNRSVLAAARHLQPGTCAAAGAASSRAVHTPQARLRRLDAP